MIEQERDEPRPVEVVEAWRTLVPAPFTTPHRRRHRHGDRGGPGSR